MADRTLIVSSDGHAVAVMPEYGPYLPAAYREDFREFCEVFAREGARTVDPASLRNRLDEELVADWIARRAGWPGRPTPTNASRNSTPRASRAR
jgi:hypothetical protein